MQEARIIYLPNHPAVPLENVFAGQEGFCKSAERASLVIENYLLTGILSRGLHFKPRQGDVVLVSAPGSGQEMLGRALACLVSDSPGELAGNYLAKDWTVPWIESRYFDAAGGGGKDDLDKANYFSPQRRVLRTQMAHTLLNPTAPRHQQGRFVCLVRHPLDLRACLFKYLRECYLVESDPQPDFDFDDFFPSADAFLPVPVGLCEMGGSHPAPDSYEQFVLDWIQHVGGGGAGAKAAAKNVHVVFYEALVSKPEQELRRIAAFLDVPFCAESVQFIQSDRLEGLGASLFARAASVRQCYTLWEMKFAGSAGGKHWRTYEHMFEHETKLRYPFPQRIMPKDDNNNDNTTSTTTASSAADQLLLAAKPFFKTVTKKLNDTLDHAARHSARVLSSISGKDTTSGATTSTTTSDEDWARTVKANLNLQASTTPTPTPTSSSNNEEEERAMKEEAQLLRMSLRQQGVNESIVKTVAVRADSLSEML